MKKQIYITLVVLITATCSIAQSTGKWVLPLSYIGYNKTIELVFEPNNPTFTENQLPFEKPYDEIGIFGGGYTPNFNDLKFYILGQDLFYNGQSYNWLGIINCSNTNFLSSVRILPLNSSGTKFEFISAAIDHETHRYVLTSRTLELINGLLVWGTIKQLGLVEYPFFMPSPNYRFSAFTVTSGSQGNYTLYVCKGHGTGSSQMALYSYSIDNNGLDQNSLTTISTPGLSFADTDFFAWQLAKSKEGFGVDALAWCNSSGFTSNPSYPDRRSHLNLVVNGQETQYMPNLGPINGVAFSEVESNILYLSCEGSAQNPAGVYKLNYTTGSVTSYFGASSTLYNRTWLKKAPDGHIYAVRNDGKALGRINQTNGQFQANAHIFAGGNSLNSYYTIPATTGNNYYYLPDDSRPANPLTATSQTTFTGSCGDATGSATLTVNGGTPPYTYQWYSALPWTAMIGYTSSTAQNLIAGQYKCIITDAWGFVLEVLVNITTDPNAVASTMQEMEGTVSGQTRAFKEGLMVKTGKTLTLNNCNYTFYQDAKVIVEPGGKLVMNNTVFTACPGVMWKGVEVWGNRYAHQYNTENGTNSQGQLIMRNGATISHAEIAVLLTSRNASGTFLYNKSGGIIKTENDGNPGTFGAKFINNSYGVRFWTYHNIYYGKEVSNLSDLTDCSFMINNEYRGGNGFDAHVHMYDVMGVKIRGCQFLNQTANPQGHGINAWGSGFRVESLCSEAVVPCPAQFTTRTSFTNFAKGINLLNSGSYTLYVNNALFNSNSRGVNLQNSNYATIINSTFNIGKASAIEEAGCEEGGAAGYGIYLTQSINFTIEENSFSKGLSAPTGEYIGIAVVDCKSPLDVIYKNTFSGLSVGNYSFGVNRSDDGDDATGIRYICNLNSSNAVDFRVTGENDLKAMINGNHGYYNAASGNTFSSTASWHFRNEGKQNINWFHYGYANEYPLPSKVYTVETDKYFYWYSAPQNTCPSHFMGGGGFEENGLPLLSEIERIQKEQEYIQYSDDYASLISIFNNLKDGGDTPGTLAEIEYVWPQNMWELVTNLLTKSPYLSEEVLIEAANRNDVIPHAALFDILAANPDELKKETLITYIKEMSNPLPEYMISILEGLAAGATAKTALLNQMDFYNTLKIHTVQALIRNSLLDTITDNTYVKNWLAKLNALSADQQTVLINISEHKIDSALVLLDLIPNKYNLTGQELTEYNDYRTMVILQMNLATEGRTLYNLDTSEVEFIYHIANNSTGKAASMAKGILEWVYGDNYCHCISGTHASWIKSGRSVKNQNWPNTIEVRAFPNPASIWVTFDYLLPVGINTGTITITDIQGKVVKTFELNRNRSQKLWDTRITSSGVYFYTIRAANNTVSGKIIVK